MRSNSPVRWTAPSGTAATALVGIAFFVKQAGTVKALGLVYVIGGVVMWTARSPMPARLIRAGNVRPAGRIPACLTVWQ